MNREQFIKYTSDFSSLDSKSLEDIRTLLDEFPHFQSAWILYAKNLHKIKDVRFESKLKIASVYIPDRRVLSRIINDTYIPGLLKKNTTPAPESIVTVNIPEKEEKPYIEIITENNNTEEPLQSDISVVEFLDESEIAEYSDSFKIPATEYPDFIQEQKDIAEFKEKIAEEPVSEEKENIDDETSYLPEQTSEVDIISEKTEPEQSDNTDLTDIKPEEINKIEFNVSDSFFVSEEEQISEPINFSSEFESSAADKILQNIEEIKTGNFSQDEKSSDSESETDKLRQIIEQRLRELGISPPEKVAELKEEIAEEPVSEEKIQDNPDNDQVSNFVNSIKVPDSSEQIVINETELLDFDFDGGKMTESGNIPDSKTEKTTVFNHTEKQISEINKPEKVELIDKFLALNPRIIPDREYVSNDSAAMKSLLSDEEELFSETLAKIYINQGHLEKAMLTYEKLCLKYPEKNIYFAGQIERIKELIKNKKN